MEDRTPFSKPAWYDVLQPYTGLTNHRDQKVHEHHRQVWDYGFTNRGLFRLVRQHIGVNTDV